MNWRMLFCVLVLCTAAMAVEDGDVIYAGGTIAAVAPGSTGQINTAARDALIFEGKGNRFEIPYAAISSFEISQDVARHLGVLPAIGTGLLRHRQRRHFLRIEFQPANATPHVVIFEVPKYMPKVLQAVLETRAPQACGAAPMCGRQSLNRPANPRLEDQRRAAR